MKVCDWFAQRAPAVDQAQTPPHDGLTFLAERGLLAKGISKELGGNGGNLEDMAEVIATVASECLTSAFVLWSHRMFLEYIMASGNPVVQEAWLPKVLALDRFGAIGLANAMRHALGMEEMHLRAETAGKGAYLLSGRIPWASNLVQDRFVIAAAAKRDDGGMLLAAVSSDAPGLERGSERPLLALDGTASASVHFEQVRVTPENIIQDDGRALLGKVRPVLMLLQSAFAWGIAEKALACALPQLTGARASLMGHGRELQVRFNQLVSAVRTLCQRTSFDSPALQQTLVCRKELVELALDAARLELEAVGGAGYIASSATARRLREAAFFLILTPTLVQLNWELDADQPCGSHERTGQWTF